MKVDWLGRWWAVLLLYGFGGLALGLADGPLGQVARQSGLRPGVVTAVSVNLVLPLLAVSLAVSHRRPGAAVVGALAMTAGFLTGLALVHPPQGWDAVTLLRAVRPVHVLACAGYAVIGLLTVLVARGVGEGLGQKPARS
jgi:hypothetical protein